MKKLTALVLSVLLLFGTAPLAFAQDHVQAYWPLHDEYNAALSSGDADRIIQAVKAIEALYAQPRNKSQRSAVTWGQQKCAQLYEQNGDFVNAKAYYEKFLENVTWLNNNGENYADSIKTTKAILNHLSLAPQVYVEAEYPADVPHFGAKHEPANGVFFGTCATFTPDETAFLLYVEYFSQTVEMFSYLLPEDKSIPVEIAWNVPENLESLERVASGESDSYMIENLKFIASDGRPVLLRFAAEANCWDIPEDAESRRYFIETFQKAFRRVSDFARQYAPNAAMLFSPNDISNWNTSAREFYPGDEYVDWIGLSMYDNLDPNATFAPGDGVDAFYCRGLFDNPLVKVREVIETVSANKPILISECGFAYNDPAGNQTEEHAVRKLKEFYSYITMVYPQVKGVMYFNKDMEKDFSLTGNAALGEAYRQAVAQNVALQSSVTGSTRGYTRFSTINESLDSLNFSVYASYPTQEPVSVSYTIDGGHIPSEEALPFRARVDVGSLTPGKHTLGVAISCAKTYETFFYDFYVGKNGFVSTVPFENDIAVTVNGERVKFDARPQIIDDRTLVPLRAIFEALGAQVNWNADTKTVTAERQETQVSLTIGSNALIVNGEQKTLDVPAQIIQDRTLVPVRAIAESFRCIVDWDGERQMVTVTEN